MSTPWPRSLLPKDRDNSWNTLQDCIADAYRERKPGEKVTAVLVVVKDGEGRSSVIVRGQDGTRRVSSDEEAEAGAA